MAADHRATRQPIGAPESAREVAATVLTRVTDQGAFAMPALDAEIRRARLSERDAALATEIVYGSLRVLPALDAVIAPHLKRPLADMDALTRAVLRTGAYQLWHLGRSPVHAIVDTSVGFIRRVRGRQVAGFANAVLRRLSEQRPADPQPPRRTHLPSWLHQLLADDLGPERAAALLENRAGAPPLCLCVPHGQRDAVLRELSRALPGTRVEPGGLSDDAVLLWRGGDPRRLPGYAEGRFWVQEEGAQLVARAAGVAPGHRVLDLCAGHGGKTLFLANRLAGRGAITSVDVDESKLDRIGPELARVGLSTVAFGHRAVDLQVGAGDLAERGYDRILVDAPCAGLGTLHRRPELVLRLAPPDLDRLAALQVDLLARAASLLAPGGRLTYAVCSLSRREGSEVAIALEGRIGRLQRVDAAAHLIDIASDSDQILRLGPWLQSGASEPDGYQVVSWEVSA